MKMHLFGRNRQRGSALLASMIVVVILSFAAAGVLSYSLTTYRNSVRQALLDQAKEVADSEMEYLYFQWKAALLSRQHTVGAVQTYLSTYPGGAPACVVSPGNDLTTSLTPFSNDMRGAWTVSRSLNWDRILGTPDGGAQGLVPGTVQVGKNYFYTAETRATTFSPTGFFGKIEFHSGRHFVYSSTSLFQFAVFYQGNLEIAAGGNMVITGPISTNASAYMGSQTNYTLTLTDKAYYFQDYNGASDPTSGETDRLQGAGALVDPVYNPNPLVAPPNQTTQRAQQVVKNASQSSFIGGIDVAAAIANYPTAYTNPQGAVDPNEVYRAVIAPPPVDAMGNPIPEDPVVASSRMYNGASIVVTIKQNAPGTPGAGNVTVDVGTAADPTYYTSNNIITPLQVSTIVPPSGYRQAAVNKREEANGTAGVNLTTVDIGQLNKALSLDIPANPTTLGTSYNGLVYVYDKTDPTNSPPNTVNAVMLTDGQQTPAYNDASGNPLGFSVASNNGVYVQGDYNVAPITVNGVSQNNPAAIMGDAVTAVSVDYTAANSGSPIASRVAGPSSDKTLPAIPLVQPAYTGSTTGMTVNAAILTGNTPSTATYNSGGVQNLVRMEEDWWHNSLTLTLNGSVGQLFSSDYFTGRYLGNSYQASISDKVYVQPSTRNVLFDSNFQNHAPSGTPVTTQFSRGDFFYW